jgi:SAM-dependent methyltransferase
MEDVKGLRIANLLGSNGRKAVPLALLGAKVTVVDFSPGNVRYGRELAAAAGVDIQCVLCDVLALPEEDAFRSFDLVLMELGILWYFTNLTSLFGVVHRILRPGGRLLLRDAHPIKAKLLAWEQERLVAAGSYFDEAIRESSVAYAGFLPEVIQSSLPKCHLRLWTLGEILTAVASSGLLLRRLIEEPGDSSFILDQGAPPEINNRFPSTFTLVADKPQEV